MNATLASSTRSQRLKDATRAAHEVLDSHIMASTPFATRGHYGRFLRMQHAFHHDLAPLFSHPALGELIPGLSQRQRLAMIGQDLADLGLAPPAIDVSAAVAGTIDTASGLGWLYVAEGSNLGAAILFKLAATLGLDADFGARHLAGHPDGRMRHWREFTALLDGMDLAPEEEGRLVAGAQAAFARVLGHAQREMGDD